MAGENLIYTFGGDASKLNAEIKFVQKNLQNLDRQISAAFKAGDTARARELSNASGKLKTDLTGLNQTLQGTEAGLNRVTRAGRQTEQQFRRIAFSANSIGRLVGGAGGGFAGGLASFAAVSALNEAKKLLDDQIERITKIRDLSRDIARSPAAVAAAQNIGRAAGESEDVVNKALQTQAANFAELEKRRIGTVPSQSAEAQAKREELIQQRARLLGGGVVSEKDAALDLSKIYEILVVDVARFKGNAEAAANFIDQSFLKIVKSGRLSETQLNEVAKALYGISAPAATTLATENIAKFSAEVRKLKGPLSEAEAALQRMREEQGKLANATQEATQEGAANYAKFKTAIAVTAQEIIKTGITNFGDLEGKAAATAGKATGEAFKNAFTAILSPGDPEALGAAETSKTIGQAFSGLPNIFQGITKTIGDVWNGLWKQLSISAHAAELSTAKSAQAMAASFAQAAAAAQGAINTIQGALSMAQGAAQLAAAAQGGGASGAGAGGVSVFRGGTGFPSPYGPPTGGYGYGPKGSGFRETASPSRGGDPREGGTSPYLQSYAPGMSDYQALPPQRVDPIEYSAAMGWGMVVQSAKDAAIASQTAAEASRMAVQGWADPSRRYAEGGMIRGSGTGTSDSIMARLSNGEFVMRAAAVRSLGAGFLSNLNRFAGGGMVMPSRGIPSFASGGLVTAGGMGGATVNLVFPGGTFSLRGDNEVVSALAREARRAGMLAAGRGVGAVA